MIRVGEEPRPQFMTNTPHLSNSVPYRGPLVPKGQRSRWPSGRARYLPWILIGLGMLLLIGGLVLDAATGGNPYAASATLSIPVAEGADGSRTTGPVRSARVELDSAERNARRGASGTTVEALGDSANGVFQVTAVGDNETDARRALDDAIASIEDRRIEELTAARDASASTLELELTTAIAELQALNEIHQADPAAEGVTHVEIFRSGGDLLEPHQVSVNDVAIAARIARISSLETQVQRASSGGAESSVEAPRLLDRSEVTTAEVPGETTWLWRGLAAAGFMLAGIGGLLLLWWSGWLAVRGVRLGILILLLALFVWMAFVVWTLSQARQAGIDALGGTDSIRGVSLSLDSLDDLNDVSTELAEVDDNLARAANRLQSRWLVPLQFIPGLGSELSSSKDLVGSASEVVSEGRNLVVSVLNTVDRMETGSASRPEGIAELREAVDQTNSELARLTIPSNADLPPQLWQYRDRLDTEVGTVGEAVDRAAGGLQMLDEFFGMDGRWLLVGGHSGENHAMTGSFLRFGAVDVVNGDISVGPLRSTQRGDFVRGTDLAPLAPGTIGAYDPDYQQLFGALHPEENWIGLGLSPRFDASAELLVQMWEASTGDDIAGVIYVDSVGLSQLVVPLGSVEVNGQTFEPRDVRYQLVTGQYLQQRDNSERVDAVLGLARQVINELTQYRDFAELAPALIRATEERHLMMWSADPERQAVFEDLGIAGSLQGNNVGVAVSSMNGKWDPFISLEVEMSTACFGDTGQVTMEAVIEFESVPGAVTGDELSLNRWGPDGTFIGMVGFTIPGSAERVDADLGEHPGAFGPDGPTQMHTGWVRLAQGESQEFSIKFDAAAFADVAVMAAGREGATRWTVGDTVWKGLAPRTIEVCGQ